MSEIDDDLLLDNDETQVSTIEDKSTDDLHDCFMCSYLNFLIGGVILVLIAIGCSLRTHKFKKRQNYSKATKWSNVTLITNSLSTLTGLIFLGYLIFRYFK